MTTRHQDRAVANLVLFPPPSLTERLVHKKPLPEENLRVEKITEYQSLAASAHTNIQSVEPENFHHIVVNQVQVDTCAR